MIPTTLAEDLRQRARALDHFLTRHAESLRKFEAAEKRFNDITAAYRAKHGDTVEADFNAANDSRLRQAMADCAYYRDRAQLYATSALMEMARGGLS